MAGIKTKLKDVRSETEYSVYIFRPSIGHNDNLSWEKRHTTKNMYKALRKAEALYGTREFPRVEIKKRVFDSKAERNVEKTFKIFQDTASIPVGMWSLCASGVLLAATIALATFFKN